MPRQPSVIAAIFALILPTASALAEDAPTPPVTVPPSADAPATTGSTTAAPDSVPATKRPILMPRRGCDHSATS